jgi:hypothetical protein
MNNYNLNHPEKEPNEIWLENVSKFSVDENGDRFSTLTKDDWYKCYTTNTKYKTARSGDIAYGIRGDKMPEFYPVFIQKSEYELAKNQNAKTD